VFNCGRSRERENAVRATLGSLAIAILGCGPAAAALDAGRLGQLEAAIAERMAVARIPGVSVGIIEDGRVAYLKGFGQARADGTPMAPASVLPVASLTKPLTALAVVQVADEGRLDLDATVSTYLPGFRLRDDRSGRITVRHLLTHTSGFSTRAGQHDFLDRDAGPDALGSAVAALACERLRRDPGQGFEYSNANYTVLGRVLEVVEGAPFEGIVAARILRPARMDASGFGEATARLAQPHRYWLGWPVPLERPLGARRTVSAAGLRSSVEDLLRFMLAVMPEQGSPLVRDAGRLFVAIPERPGSPDGYALGWHVDATAHGKWIYHSGSAPGAQTFMGYVPARRRGWVVLVNAGDGFVAGDARGVIRAVSDALLERPLRPPASFADERALGIAIVAMGAGLLWHARRLRRRTDAGAARIAGACLALLAYAWGLLFALPYAHDTTLSATLAYRPDAGWLLVVLGAPAGLAGLLDLARLSCRLFRRARRRRGPPTPAPR
jgi:CubicO group peptidase (beta-lactamase class C family)